MFLRQGNNAMIRWLLIAVLALITSAVCADESKMPKSVPPVFATAKATIQNKELQISLTCPIPRWQVTGDVVPKKEWPKLQADVQKYARTLNLGGPSQLAESRVVDIHGKNLDEKEILKRLKVETPVLVSVDGEMLDPYYLKLVKEDTVVIVLGPRDGMPSPELLPSAKGK